MKFLLAFLFFLFHLISFSQSLFIPEKTKIVIIGVLKWEDPNISTFSDRNRKDQELYDLFIEMGVPKENISLLLDQEATLSNMQDAIRSKMEVCESDETFIFYYAGHGVKTKDKYYFCNYDMGAKSETQFDVSFLNKTASKKFKGKRVLLLADCCYSGVLLKTGETISKKKKEVVVMTSATSSNISTGNWTFTQTLLDNLRGENEGDRDKNGEISLTELSVEMYDAMKYRERQLNGFKTFLVDADKTIVQKTKEKPVDDDSKSEFKIHQYVYALTRGNWQPARIKSINASDITIEFYEYSDKREEIIDLKFVRNIQTPDYSGLDLVEVKWEKKVYPAKIIKRQGDFYFIAYDGYDATWNEWVMYDRIKTGNEKEASVLWNTGWYKAEVLQEKDEKYFIHYKGYDHTWDEWAEKERVKF